MWVLCPILSQALARGRLSIAFASYETKGFTFPADLADLPTIVSANKVSTYLGSYMQVPITARTLWLLVPRALVISFLPPSRSRVEQVGSWE